MKNYVQLGWLVEQGRYFEVDDPLPHDMIVSDNNAHSLHMLIFVESLKNYLNLVVDMQKDSSKKSQMIHRCLVR